MGELLQRADAGMAKSIAHLLKAEPLPLYIYGAGLHASEIESFLRKHEIPIDGFFVDGGFLRSDHRVRGSVITLDQLRQTHENFHVVVGFCRDPSTVRKQILEKGIGGSGRTIFVDCRFWKQFEKWGEYSHSIAIEEIGRIRSSFADELSRTSFDEVLRAKLTNDPVNLPALVRVPQYYPMDLVDFAPSESDVVVDAGAFTGDTLIDFLSRIPAAKCRGYHAFEADPANASILEKTIQERGLASFAVAHRLALGDRDGSVSFVSGNGSSSKISADGGNQVTMVRLDSLDLAPTLIKMDIEGAEPAALRGAAQTIATHYPRLAISVYHSLEDFLEIPSLVLQLGPEYRLYLRLSRPYTEEIVLYATR